MRVEFDSIAREKLEKALNGQQGYFKLITENEGCATGGIFNILLLSEPEAADKPIESEAFSFLVDSQQEIYFEQTLRLKGHPTFPSFRLSSDSMLYSDHVIIKDRRVNLNKAV
ncbi:iron-sulfur cluster biosynthesis family protein [Paenibacillus physcomitrellae]|uniref:Core domain-containing protein n=1 Tax=Paenibacillus physcomitrellae TaxID=1619311 RepID=A0ABQ1FL52_9BACL|nr:iron-sulfur cluster biosynthesis family protein [Paenibacillus physcomitrellae]GGA19758.1 hypothetical protein GCM10010917_00450 [Paenibacillus physcomitrellae]